MKRRERKRLKEDEFVGTLTKIAHFTRKKTKEITIGLGLVVFLGFVFIVYKGIHAVQLRKESHLTAEILELNEQLGQKPENLTRLEKLAGKGKFSRMAYIFIATYSIEKGDFAKAEEALQKINDRRKDFVYYQAQDLLGQVYMLRKDYEKALEIFRKMEKETPKSYALDVILFHQAEALEKSGKKEEALALFQKVQDKFPQTYYGYDASLKLLQIGKAK